MLKLNYLAHILIYSKYRIYFSLILYIIFLTSLNTVNVIQCMMENDDIFIGALSEMEEQLKTSSSAQTHDNSLHEDTYCRNCRKYKDKADSYKFLYEQINSSSSIKEVHFNRELDILKEEINVLKSKNIELQEVVASKDTSIRKANEQEMMNILKKRTGSVEKVFPPKDYYQNSRVFARYTKPVMAEPLTDDAIALLVKMRQTIFENDNRVVQDFDLTNANNLSKKDSTLEVLGNELNNPNKQKKLLVNEFKDDLALVSEAPKPLLLKSKSDTNLYGNFFTKVEQKTQIDELQSQINAVQKGYNVGVSDIREQLHNIESEACNEIARLSAHVKILQEKNTYTVNKAAQIIQQVENLLNNRK